MVVRPPEALKISITRDKNELQRVYDIGRREGLASFMRVREFLN